MKIIVVAAIVLWLFVCIVIYRFFRHAAWLAGSTAASCLFFLGATIATSFLVEGALFLAPLWLGIFILLGFHLHKALRKELRTWSPQVFDGRKKACISLSHDNGKASYI